MGELLQPLRMHPRVAQQGVSLQKSQEVAASLVSRLKPFRGHSVHAISPLLDWDHRLPSRSLTLRLHVSYDEGSKARFEQALERRTQEIAKKNRYPEFDVPDFVGLTSDEAYDAELTYELALENMRLVSPWRREVDLPEADRATELVRMSKQFAEVRKNEGARAAGLGDLEAVAWTPPCESQHEHWTVDVWWLTSFDGRLGKGWSFLVDLEVAPPAVVASREFTVRAG